MTIDDDASRITTNILKICKNGCTKYIIMESLSKSDSKSLCICSKCKNAEVEIWNDCRNYCVNCWQEITETSPSFANSSNIAILFVK